jgi:hypothetical protein
VVGASKPHFLIANFNNYFNHKSMKFKELFFGIFGAIMLSVWGFAVFSGGVIANARYFYNSLFSFTAPNPSYIVHFNDSIIGNMLSIESVLNIKALNNSFVLHNQNIILVLYLMITLFITFLLVKDNAPKWLTVWVLGGLSAVLIPVSYPYAYTFFLIPLGLLLNDLAIGNRNTIELLSIQWNKILLALSLFLIFSPKYGFITLIPGVADTRLYSLFSSFSHFLVLVIGINLLVSKKLKQVM